MRSLSNGNFASRELSMPFFGPEGPLMMVIALTVFVGLALVTFFVLVFIAQASRDGIGGDHEALLPLAEEGTASQLGRKN
jgi:hypothetical protein